MCLLYSMGFAHMSPSYVMFIDYEAKMVIYEEHLVTCSCFNHCPSVIGG